jgi:hypothetical protein
MRVVKTSSAANRSNTLESASNGRPIPALNFVTTTQIKIPIPIRENANTSKPTNVELDITSQNLCDRVGSGLF